MYPNPGNPYPGGPPPFGSGYPSQPPFGAGGYPGQQPGYPGQQPGYPPQGGVPFGAGYPPAQPMYPQMPMPGMPPQQSPQHSMYPSMPGAAPMQQQGYPSPPMGQQPYPGSGYPPAPAPNANTSYPTSGYPPQQSYQPPPTQDYVQQQTYQNYGSAPPMSHQQAPMNQQSQGRPTVHPAPNFDASADCGVLRKAMKGFGTDEDALINVLCRRTVSQRVQIVRTYKTAYGKDLFDDIRSETSGNFQRLLLALLVETSELYAREIFEAVNGAGTDESALIEVMCLLTNQEIRSVGYKYFQMYGKSLESELKGDTSGTFRRLMTSLSVGGRDESMMTDVNQAKNDANELKRAGVDKWGTDESTFNRILCTRNYAQLRLVADEYQALTGNSLEKDIKREFSGDIEDGLLAVLRTAMNRPESFATRLHKSMAGLGTNDNSLIRLVVSRCDIDMEDIKEAFNRKFGKSLKSFIKGDTSGHYKHALYALIGENRS